MMNKKKDPDKTSESYSAALFYIRNTNIELDKDLTEVLIMLKSLENLNHKICLIFISNFSTSESIIWESVIERLNDHLSQIREQLTHLKENRSSHCKLHSNLFWQQNEDLMESLAAEYRNLEEIGFQVLPPKEKMYWRMNVCDVQSETCTALVSLITICKQQFNFIKQYTPIEVNTITQTIINTPPPTYSLNEA
ncbi:hypothetical protein [Kaistella jeonii]|nr:hypothetical protein [Kaistella jeonii]